MVTEFIATALLSISCATGTTTVAETNSSNPMNALLAETNSPLVINKPFTTPNANNNIFIGDYLASSYGAQNLDQSLPYTVLEDVTTSSFSGTAPGCVSEEDSYFEAARAGLVETGHLGKDQYYGCGRIALFTIADYYMRTSIPGIRENANNLEDSRKILVENVVRLTPGWDGGNAGTGVLEFDYISGLDSLLRLYGYGDGTYEIVTRDDFTPFLGTLNIEQAETYLVDQLERGNAFVFRTSITSEFYKTHYVTCYGYSKVAYIDWNGYQKQKILFRIKQNWGEEYDLDYYFDLNWLNQNLWETAFSDFCVIDFNEDFESEFDVLTVEPEMFPFGTVYPSENALTPVTVSHPGFDSFDCNRLRSQNYENECLVLSPLRDNYRQAYLTLEFPYPFYWFEVDLSWWRNRAYESVVAGNYRFYIQARRPNSSGWADYGLYDLASHWNQLPENRNNMLTLRFTCYADSVRFISYAGADNVYFEENRGRLAIGGMRFGFSPADYALL